VNNLKKASMMSENTELATSGKHQIFHWPLYIVTADQKLLHRVMWRWFLKKSVVTVYITNLYFLMF